MNCPRALMSLCVACLVVAGCSDDGTTSPGTAVATTVPATTVPATDAPTTSAETDTVAPATTAPVDTAPPSEADTPEIAALRPVVETLAADQLNGRDNLTDDSLAAQAYLIEQLRAFADPIDPGAAGDDGYRQAFAQGVNLLAVIPGGDLADEYVIVGAHYDHLGNDCGGISGADNICNGAIDNATGVAAALAIGRSLAADPQPPRRSVIIALWDAEEDGLLGSAAYLNDPLVPVEQTVGYVNFDIQGTSMSPALTDITVMVGAETGGPNLRASALAAAGASSLDTMPLSLLFGQGRSDHANFTAAGVPSVFFTDATPPCYHTVGDDASIVDYPKLVQQVATAEALTRDLSATDTLPVFDAAAPAASYDDAVSMLHIVSMDEPDFPRFTAGAQRGAAQFLLDLQAIVDAGPDAFGPDSVGVLLSGALLMVDAWATGKCEAFFMG